MKPVRLSRWKIFLVVLAFVIISIFFVWVALAPTIGNIFSNISMADCAWSASASAWADANRDGVRDADERPMANVAFYVDDILNNNIRMSAGTSDASGNARLYIFIAGCPQVEMEFYPQPPHDYCLTTPERAKSSDAAPHEFGFAPCP